MESFSGSVNLHIIERVRFWHPLSFILDDYHWV